MAIGREKIKPVIDIPLLVQLDTTEGVRSESQFTGLEFRYDAKHEGRPVKLYVKEEGRDAILRAQPIAGDLVEILMQKDRSGEFVWSAHVISDGDEPPPPVLPESPRSRPARQLSAPIPNGKYTEPQKEVLRRVLPAKNDPSRSTPTRNEQPTTSPLARQVGGCLRTSFDAWELLREHAANAGVDFSYTSEDVRAFAISIFIDQRGNR